MAKHISENFFWAPHSWWGHGVGTQMGPRAALRSGPIREGVMVGVSQTSAPGRVVWFLLQAQEVEGGQLLPGLQPLNVTQS